MQTLELNNTPPNLHNHQKQNKPIMSKHLSQPKFTSLKQQILKIPKVKQILQKDKFLYSQDIEKRIQLIGSLKNQRYVDKQMGNLCDLRKDVLKKSKRHKTNFKIPLSRKNIQSLNCLVKTHVEKNQILKNEQKVFLKQYSQKAPFDLQKLKFMDDINPLKKKYKQKYPDFKEGVLSKNKLLLQHVILNRNLKRQIKLDQKKSVKEHAKNVFRKAT